MLRSTLIFFFLCFSLSSFGQLALRPSFAYLHSPSWSERLEDLGDISPFSLTGGLNSLSYSFALKKLNIRFPLMITGGIFRQDFEPRNGFNQFNHHLRIGFLGVDFNSNIHFLSLKKENENGKSLSKGAFIKKNLYLIAGLGFYSSSSRYSNFDNLDSFRFSSQFYGSDEYLQTNIGLGLNIPVAHFFTLSPFFEFRFFKPQNIWFPQSNTVGFFDDQGNFIEEVTINIFEGAKTNSFFFTLGTKLEIKLKN